MNWTEKIGIDISGLLLFITAIVSIWIARHQFSIFRSDKPYLNISHEVNCEKISEQDYYVMVTFLLHNASKVQFELRNIKITMRHITYMAHQETIKALRDHLSYNENNNNMSEIFKRHTYEYEIGQRLIEPNEIHKETYEFVVNQEYEIITIESKVIDETQQNIKDPNTWWNKSLHRIVETEENIKWKTEIPIRIKK